MKQKAGKVLGILCAALAILIVLSACLSVAGVLVYPFNFAPAPLACLLLLALAARGWAKDSKTLHKLLLSVGYAALLGVTLVAGAVVHRISPSGRGTEYISPKGTTVIVEYTLVDVPRVYLKHNALLRTPIALAQGPGYMETVHFSVYWEEDDLLVLDLGFYKGAYERYWVDVANRHGAWERIEE